MSQPQNTSPAQVLRWQIVEALETFGEIAVDAQNTDDPKLQLYRALVGLQATLAKIETSIIFPSQGNVVGPVGGSTAGDVAIFANDTGRLLSDTGIISGDLITAENAAPNTDYVLTSAETDTKKGTWTSQGDLLVGASVNAQNAGTDGSLSYNDGSPFLDNSGNFYNSNNVQIGSYFGIANTVVVQESTPLSGDTVIFNDEIFDTTLYLTPAGTLATLTIALPSNLGSRIGKIARIATTQTLTSLTITAVGGSIIGTNPSTLLAGGMVSFQKVADNTWFRMA